MIIFGSNASELAQLPLEERCHNCGTSNSLRLHIMQKWAHVFWIPVFPLGKSGATECSHCKQVLRNDEFSLQQFDQFEQAKKQVRTSWWTFTGLGLFFLLISVAAVNIRRA